MTDASGYDVAIVGSGFGGSLIAAILAQAGLSVAVVDRRRHPRFAIGESSTPAADLILHDLALRYDLPELLPFTRFGSWRKTHPEILCGCKRGFTYFWHGDEGGFRPSADHRHELFVAASASQEVADTQWYRPDVDQFFVSVAQNHSARLLEETVITAMEHPEPHSWKLRLDRNGTSIPLNARFLIDAGGAAGVLPRWLKLDDETSQLLSDSSAVYGHWDGVAPYEESLRADGAQFADYPFPVDDSAIHHLFRDGWAFQLRFANGLTSLGSVFVPGRRRRPGFSLEESIAYKRPVLAQILAAARLARFPGKLFCVPRMQRLWGKGADCDWAALPFTVGFVDALHSTGIAHNLSGVERLAEILLEASGAARTEALEHYSRQVVEEVRLIDLLVAGCYVGLADFRLFSAWSMLYFAAATTFEKRRLDHPEGSGGFLLADDTGFVALVRDLYRRLQHVVSSDRLTEQRVDEFQQQVKSAIAPYNQVGLFEPEVPNMYRYTSAEKH